MDKPPRRAGAFWIKAFVSAGLLTYLLARTDLQAISGLFRSMRLSLFVASVLLYLLVQVLSTLRWRCLLQAEAIDLSIWRLSLLYFEGMFFSLMLPTVIGGDVVRGYQIFRATQRHEASLASILVERLSGYAALILIASLGLVVAYPLVRDPALVWLTAAATVGLGALIAGLLSEQLQHVFFLGLRRVGLAHFHDTLHALYEAVQRYWQHRGALLLALGLSLVLQSTIVVIFFLISRSLNLSVPLVYFFLFVPLISVMSMLPISIAGLGVREGSAVYLFAKAGLDAAGAVSLSLLWFVVIALCSGLGGIVFLVGHPAQQARL